MTEEDTEPVILGELVSCPIHGQYRERYCQCLGKYTPLGCPDCHKRWKKIDLIAEEQSSRGKTERFQNRAFSLLGRYPIPAICERFTFDNFETPTSEQGACKYIAMEFIRSVLANDKVGSLLFYGSSGSGKTHLAAAMASVLEQKNCHSVFITVNELIFRSRETWQRKSNVSYEELMRFLSEVPFLVLDGLGDDPKTQAHNNCIIRTLVDTRVTCQRPTVFSTASSEVELREVFDKFTVDYLSYASLSVHFYPRVR